MGTSTTRQAPQYRAQTVTAASAGQQLARSTATNATGFFDLQALPSGTYQIKVEAAQCEVSKGTTDPARVTLTLALPDFLRLVSGKLNGVQAYFTGRLKVSGDAMFAQTMQGWFKQAD